MKPLKSNPQRQAIPTLRGYSYQIWQSLLRWLELRENENLFLEGAEDIDVLGPGESAETIQIKETAESGSITLRSSDVIDALNNFWEHQSKNPDTFIKFRFLTTSDRGQERPKEFEKGRGLDVWDACKREGTDNKPLRRFLGKQKSLSQELREFIENASDDELRNKLLSRFEWDTGKKLQPFVEELVRRKIVEYGDSAYTLPPSESEKTISHLLRYVWDVVRRSENRYLTREDFLKIFEEATTERVPIHELRNLKRAADAKLAQSSSGATLPIPFQNPVSLIPSPILEPLSLPDMKKFAAREKLVAELQSKLDESNLLVLTGSTGTGKSLLSYNIADRSTGAWYRLDLRGFTPEHIRDRLDYAARLIEDKADEADVILDDLNFDRQPLVYENSLGRLLYAVKLRNGRIIITSHHKPPTRIANYFDIPSENFFTVPPLDEADVKSLLVKHDCPEVNLLKAWTRLIYLQARGHALLTHTRIRALANRGWRAPDTDDLLIAEEIKDIRQEFRRSLREELPNDARALLYRLSIFVGRFKRRHALSIGNNATDFSGAANDAFDTLVGPWVEPIDSTYFRLSPLLDNTATEVFTEAQIKELHKAAAEAFLEEVISVIELNGLLFHGLAGDALQPLVAAAMSVFSAEKSGWQEIAQISGWFAHTRLNGKEKLFAGDNLVNFLLRRLQFKIMSALDSQKAVKIAQIIENEISEWNGGGSYAGTKHSITFTFINEVIFEMDVPFTIKQIAKWVLQIIPLSQSENSFFPNHPEHQAVLDEKLKFLAAADVYVRVATARCRKAEQVVELLTAFDEATETVVKEVWEIFKNDNFTASTLVDAVWLDELRAETRDWAKCLKTLDWVVEVARKREATALTAAAYQAKAIIYKEYLNDSEAAFKVLQTGEDALGESEVFLQDYRAKIYFLEKNYTAAIGIWRQILPRIEKDRNAARTFSFRDAEVCAARLGDWGEAAELALRGEEVARLPFLDEQPPEIQKNVIGEAVAVGYRADYAFAMWKMGKRAEAFREFVNILDSFKTLPALLEDLRVQMLYRRVGYAIGWFLQNIKDNDEFEEPPPGFFSNPETVEEVKNTPLSPIANYWYLLARLEYKLRLGNSIFSSFAEKINQNGEEFGNAKIGYQDLLLKHALTNLEVENIISNYLEFSEATRKFAALNTETKVAWNESEVLKALTFTALLLYASRGQQHLLPLGEWKREAGEHGNRIDSTFGNWLELIEHFIVAESTVWVAALANPAASGDERILGALMLSANAENLDAETRFYANTILLTANYSRDWGDEAADAIEYWIVSGWRKVAEQQKFLLKNPKSNVHKILAVCDDNKFNGIAKAAKILLVVCPAIRLNVNNSVIKQLEDLSKGC